VGGWQWFVLFWQSIAHWHFRRILQTPT
jgi:hypothetical protein